MRNAESSKAQVVESEAVCFHCKRGGGLIFCHKGSCPKAYHPECIGRDAAFFQQYPNWTCGYHYCCMCNDPAVHKCFTCLSSLCKPCFTAKKLGFTRLPGGQHGTGVCEKCLSEVEGIGAGSTLPPFKEYWEFAQASYGASSPPSAGGRGVKRARSPPLAPAVEWAAVSLHNTSLLFLSRSLAEKLLWRSRAGAEEGAVGDGPQAEEEEDPAAFSELVRGGYVRIRVPPSTYRILPVVGAVRRGPPYKVGGRATSTRLQVSNLGRVELLTMDLISNQRFSAEEVARLREQYLYGVYEPLTVGQVRAKALELSGRGPAGPGGDGERERLVAKRARAEWSGDARELQEAIEALEALEREGDGAGGGSGADLDIEVDAGMDPASAPRVGKQSGPPEAEAEAPPPAEAPPAEAAAAGEGGSKPYSIEDAVSDGEGAPSAGGGQEASPGGRSRSPGPSDQQGDSDGNARGGSVSRSRSPSRSRSRSRSPPGSGSGSGGAAAAGGRSRSSSSRSSSSRSGSGSRSRNDSRSVSRSRSRSRSVSRSRSHGRSERAEERGRAVSSSRSPPTTEDGGARSESSRSREGSRSGGGSSAPSERSDMDEDEGGVGGGGGGGGGGAQGADERRRLEARAAELREKELELERRERALAAALEARARPPIPGPARAPPIPGPARPPPISAPPRISIPKPSLAPVPAPAAAPAAGRIDARGPGPAAARGGRGSGAGGRGAPARATPASRSTLAAAKPPPPQSEPSPAAAGIGAGAPPPRDGRPPPPLEDGAGGGAGAGSEIPFHYMDPDGDEQGPFPLWRLRGWFDKGMFPRELRVRRGDLSGADAAPLEEVLAREDAGETPGRVGCWPGAGRGKEAGAAAAAAGAGVGAGKVGGAAGGWGNGERSAAIVPRAGSRVPIPSPSAARPSPHTTAEAAPPPGGPGFLDSNGSASSSMPSSRTGEGANGMNGRGRGRGGGFAGGRGGPGGRGSPAARARGEVGREQAAAQDRAARAAVPSPDAAPSGGSGRGRAGIGAGGGRGAGERDHRDASLPTRERALEGPSHPPSPGGGARPPLREPPSIYEHDDHFDRGPEYPRHGYSADRGYDDGYWDDPHRPPPDDGYWDDPHRPAHPDDYWGDDHRPPGHLEGGGRHLERRLEFPRHRAPPLTPHYDEDEAFDEPPPAHRGRPGLSLRDRPGPRMPPGLLLHSPPGRARIHGGGGRGGAPSPRIPVPCNFFKMGACKKGSSCRFLHPAVAKDPPAHEFSK